jgi:DNA invertase Pin-like site-specific DNA recombinase
MNYGYIRVSTDKQTVENQRYEINKFARTEKICIDEWVEETISGTKEVYKRALGGLLNKLHTGDTLICSEISRLGRSLFMIMDILNYCMKSGIQVWTIKDNYRLGTDISSKVLAFAFGLSAEIERNLISQRTKEALQRAMSEGKHVGRPKGSKNKKLKLTGQEAVIKKKLKAGWSKTSIAKMLGVHRFTLYTFCRKMEHH